MNQLLIGACLPFTAGLIYYLLKKRRASFAALIFFPVLMLASMAWAIAPDLPRFFGFRDLYYKLALDPRCNIFYWHYSIDLTESDSPLYFIGFILIASSMLFAVWREIKLSEEN